jgi:hypothetical protein
VQNHSNLIPADFCKSAPNLDKLPLSKQKNLALAFGLEIDQEYLFGFGCGFGCGKDQGDLKSPPEISRADQGDLKSPPEIKDPHDLSRTRADHGDL